MGRNLFGSIAQQKGYASFEDVEKALSIQKKIEKSGQPHKLIGIIMLEQGIISSKQLLEILKEIEAMEKNIYF